MGQKFEYKKQAKEISDGSTNVDIEFPAVDDGWKRTLQHISCEDETSGCDEIRIGYVTQFGVYHWWVEQETAQAGVLYWISDPKVIQEGDKLVIRFTGTTLNDILSAYVDGFSERMRE